MARLSDWETRLNAYLASVKGQPYQYGTLDCALFAASAAAAITGVDNAKAFRGKYSTQAGSIKALKRIGKGNLEKTFDHFYPERPLGFVRRGDLVFDGESVGVCVGAHALFIGEQDGREGLYRVARSEWQKGWAV